jgi:hypothetical protein
MDVKEVATIDVDCGLGLHKRLGPGMLESSYETNRLMKPPVIPAEAGTQTGPMFRGFAAFFGEGLGPVLRRDDESVRCTIGIKPCSKTNSSVADYLLNDKN